jgi:hypothetical protein
MDEYHGGYVMALLSEFSWTIIVGVAAFGVKFLRDLSKSVEQLNQNILVILGRVDNHEKMIDDHESRLRSIER